MNVLIFDIEQAPATYANWRTDPGYLPHYMQKTPPFIASWAAKWYGRKRIYSDTVKQSEARKQDDKRIIESLAEYLRKADVVIGHAVERHDLAKIRGKVVKYNLDPLPPNIRSIDTLTLIKRDLGYDYNGMEALCLDWGIPTGKKIGMANWMKVLDGDWEALDKLRKYNRADIVSTEAIFEKIKPHVRRLPRLVDGPGFKCPSCGSEDLQKRGLAKTQVSTFQQWQCNNCKRYSRSKSLAEKRLPVHPL